MSILAVQAGYKDNAESWREVFKDLGRRGLDMSAVRIGVTDGLPGLQTAFGESFPQAVTGRCGVHALRTAMAKVPERPREPFKKLAHLVMCAERNRWKPLVSER